MSDDELTPEQLKLLQRSKTIISEMEKIQLLPKHWEPKNDYVEVEKGNTERVILKSDLEKAIKDGWQITRLSKVSPALIKSKWINAIISMENES